MQPIIPPVDPEVILRELGETECVAEFRGLRLCAFTADQAPETMREIARIREEEFRKANGGTGRELDFDRYDWEIPRYSQLVALDPERGEIAAAIRIQRCGEAIALAGLDGLRTSTLFQFSPEFRDDVLPYCLELGRSVVNKDAAKSTSGLFALWTAMSRMMVASREMEHLFGVVSLYANYPAEASDAILQFLTLHHSAPDPQPVQPLDSLLYVPSPQAAEIFSGADYEADYAALRHHLATFDLPMLPILASYLGTSRTMKYYGAAYDENFASCLELAIMVSMSELNERTRKRFGIS